MARHDRDGGWGPIRTPLALAAVWVAAAVAVDPIGEFPTNDDFNYAASVKTLVERGEFHLSDWLTSSVVAQYYWGALFCLPVGFSFTALRLSTLVLGLVGVVATHALLSRFRLGRGTTAFATLLVAFNPLYFGQSYTFMTDVPFFALMVLAVWLVIDGVDRGSAWRYWAGLAAALLSMFVRQLGLGIFLGLALAYPLARPSLRSWVLHAMLPLVAAAAALQGYEAVLKAIGEYPGMFYQKHESLELALVHLLELRPGALKFPISRTLKTLVYYGLFLFPLLIPLVASATRGWGPGRRRAVLAGSAALSGAAAVGLDAVGLRMPLLGNVIVDFGMGIRSLPGGPFPAAPRLLWVALTAVGIWGAAALVALAAQGVGATVARRREPGQAVRPWHLVFFAGLCGFLFVPAAMMYAAFLDRYMLPLLPFALIVVAAAGDRPDPWSASTAAVRAASAAALAAMAALSVASVHDYLEWNRARWAAARLAVAELGVDPGRVDAGFEFNNYVHFRRHLGSDTFLTTLEVDPDTGLLPGATHVVSLRPLEGRPVIATVTCDAWLPYSPGRLFLLGDRRPAPGR